MSLYQVVINSFIRQTKPYHCETSATTSAAFSSFSCFSFIQLYALLHIFFFCFSPQFLIHFRFSPYLKVDLSNFLLFWHIANGWFSKLLQQRFILTVVESCVFKVSVLFFLFCFFLFEAFFISFSFIWKSQFRKLQLLDVHHKLQNPNSENFGLSFLT